MISLLLLLSGSLLTGSKAFSQPATDFSWLLRCFNGGPVDSFEIEIDGIGTVMTRHLASDSVKMEAALFYYDIPAAQRRKSGKKLAGHAAHFQIKTWKNNSKLLLYKQYRIGEAIIVDARLHLLIEDIYLQVVVVLENNRVYEIDHFEDTNDKRIFDELTEKIRKKICP